MTKHLLSKFILVLVLIFPSVSRAQQENLEQLKIKAYQLFHQGKAKLSAEILRSLISTKAIPSEKASLLGDLLEVCATAYEWTCVQRTLQDVLPIIKSEPTLNYLYPRIILYETKLMRWLGNDAYMEDLIRRGGAALVVSVYKEPSTYAEISLQIAIFHIRRNELRGAELNISRTMMGLLLTDVHNSYEVSKLLILLMDVLIEKQDLGGAVDLHFVADNFLLRNLAQGSILYSSYRRIIAYLYSYTNLYEDAAKKFIEAIQLIQQLEIEPAAKNYEVGVASDLAVAALISGGKALEAETIHAKNPTQGEKEAIFRRGTFANYAEFYFAITDIYLAASTGRQLDIRWKDLFERELAWKLSDLEESEFRSYREFARGVFAAAAKQAEEGRRLVIHAATERVNNFEKILKENQEGIQAARLVDRIIITAGLTAAATVGDETSLDLMLRGGEVLRRNFRSHFVDLGSVLTAQSEPDQRRNIHSFFHLLDKKHEWELEKIRRLLVDDPAAKDKGRIISEYTQAVSEIDRLKNRLAGGGNIRPASTDPCSPRGVRELFSHLRRNRQAMR